MVVLDHFGNHVIDRGLANPFRGERRLRFAEYDFVASQGLPHGRLQPDRDPRQDKPYSPWTARVVITDIDQPPDSKRMIASRTISTFPLLQKRLCANGEFGMKFSSNTASLSSLVFALHHSRLSTLESDRV